MYFESILIQNEFDWITNETVKLMIYEVKSEIVVPIVNAFLLILVCLEMFTRNHSFY